LSPLLADFNCVAEEIPDRALIALQGPLAADALGGLAPAALSLRFMQATETTIDGAAARIFRGGYTGEDGFEISLAAAAADALCERLIANGQVCPAGLGARDSLRLEAGLPLWGHELDENTSPVEAGLAFSIPKSRRQSGGFAGFETVRRHLQEGAPRRLIGIIGKEGGKQIPARSGALLFADDTKAAAAAEAEGEGDENIGAVTSGVFSPSLAAPIALGFIRGDIAAADGGDIFAEVRGRRVAFAIKTPPFVPRRYAR
jgi:aminomethyltransferase